ncbi:MAG: sodium-translocating pyrophosphatase [Patescibacteria group bacterium]|nr:sodium-translocating pyrophosphatase [Patescibacteria group bacterium]
MVYLPIIVSIFSLIFAYFLIKEIRKAPSGSGKQVEIQKAIREGAMTFLKREFQVLSFVLILIALLFSLFIQAKMGLVFLIGASFSALAGLIGMKVATMANVKVTNLAQNRFSQSFKIAFSSGAVMGICVVGLGLLGLSLVYWWFEETQLLIGYALGASLIALFLRVGGGIYTKSADVGADLVGKVEKGIPEDDPRNPAVIADAVGDNVGDIAGMGSDLFESYVSAIAASTILGASLFGKEGLFLPFLLASLGILASLIGFFLVKPREIRSATISENGISEKAKDFSEQTQNIRSAMNRGIIFSNLLMALGAYFLIKNFMGDLLVFWALIIGMAFGLLIGKVSEYFTSDKEKPVLGIAKASQTGAATTIIEGLSVGMLAILIPFLGVAIATILAFKLAGLYGIAIAGLGVLGVLGINLSADCYGPIADNAGGIAEMSHFPPEVRQKTDALDSVGNTTAAMGKGFAIGSAALVALSWLATFCNQANLEVISLLNAKVMAGLFLGTALSFIFCSLTLRAVGQGAFKVVEEVRRQFREIPGIMEGKTPPDYAKCVDIVTKAGLKKMILPGLLAVLTPVLVGFFLGLEALGALIISALVSGFALAIMLAIAGGAWDNAKKYIEAGNLGGKGSETHKAAVIGDTVGDPCKDCSGPSINILIKMIGVVALIIALFF